MINELEDVRKQRGKKSSFRFGFSDINCDNHRYPGNACSLDVHDISLSCQSINRNCTHRSPRTGKYWRPSPSARTWPRHTPWRRPVSRTWAPLCYLPERRRPALVPRTSGVPLKKKKLRPLERGINAGRARGMEGKREMDRHIVLRDEDSRDNEKI